MEQPAGAVGRAGAATIGAAVQRRRGRQPGLVESPRALRTARGRPADDHRPYAELHCHSNFSFLDGASHPEELVEEAARLGLRALALTDHDGFYGIVRFAEAAAALEMPTVFGAELTLDLPRNTKPGAPDPGGRHLVILARDPQGYAQLARAITDAHMSAGEKSLPKIDLATLAAHHPGGHWQVLTGCRKGTVPAALVERGPAAAAGELQRLVEVFGRPNVAVELWDHGDELRSRVAPTASRGGKRGWARKMLAFAEIATG